MPSSSVYWQGKTITHFDCSDCGKVRPGSDTLRPGNKFCDPLCRSYVIASDKQNKKAEKTHDNFAQQGYIALQCPNCGSKLSGSLTALKP